MTGDPVLFRRPFPSANSILLPGPRPILIDTGAGSDVDALEGWLHHIGAPPTSLALIVNTHHHSDHVGGNHRLQDCYGLSVALARAEAMAVNARMPDACRADWLGQEVEPFTVDRPLDPDDTIGTGDSESGVWQVIPTPGHSAGHISLYNERERQLILGDAFHGDDVGWIDPGPGCGLEAAIASVEHLLELDALTAWSGHGPRIDDVRTVGTAALARLLRWRSDPEAMAWHAAKRIATHRLIAENGLMRASAEATFAALPWVRQMAEDPFATTPEDFARALIAELVRAGAAAWRGHRLLATGGYVPPLPGWRRGPGRPADWPR